MTDEKKHYVLKAETGHFKVVGGSSNPVVNTAIIATNSITSLGHDFVVVPPTPMGELESKKRWRTTDAAYDPTKVPGAVIVSSAFTMIFTVVAAITIVGFIAELLFAIYWTGSLTPLQERGFSSADWAFKAGFGAILGLLGGKQTSKK